MAKDYISRSALLGYLNDIWLTATPTDSTPAEDRQFAICRCMGLQDAMDAVKEFPTADVVEQPRWIPVTERLPEEDCQVLAYYGFNRGDKYLGMMFMQVLDYYARDPKPHFQHEGLNGMTVTHWMPLPPAPEPLKEEA